MANKYKFHRFLSLILIFGFLAFGLFLLTNIEPASNIYRTLDGRETRNFTEFVTNEQVVFLVWWDTTCPYCKELLIKLNEFSKKNPLVLVVGINLGERKGVVEKFRDENNLTEIVFILGPKKLPQTMKGYQVNATPFTIGFVLGRNGFEPFAEWAGLIPDTDLARISEILSNVKD